LKNVRLTIQEFINEAQNSLAEQTLAVAGCFTRMGTDSADTAGKRESLSDFSQIKSAQKTTLTI